MLTGDMFVAELKKTRLQRNKARRELRETRGYLIGLVAVTEHFLANLDKEMKKPSDEARGRSIAAMANALELTKDIAKRYGLPEKPKGRRR